jgi:hypothetical protein
MRMQRACATRGFLLRCLIIRQVLHDEHVCGIDRCDDAYAVRYPAARNKMPEVDDSAAYEGKREPVERPLGRSGLRDIFLRVLDDQCDDDTDDGERAQLLNDIQIRIILTLPKIVTLVSALSHLASFEDDDIGIM